MPSTRGIAEWPGSCWVGAVDLRELDVDELELADGSVHSRARFLVRDGRTPLGFVEVPADAGVVNTSSVREAAERQPVPSVPVTSARPPISVVLCTRDRPDQLRHALQSLVSLDYPEFEVVVVDNASATDGSARTVEALGDPRVRLVSEPAPGLARARNTGLTAARHGIVAFTDDDVLVDRWWLHGIADGFGEGEDVACVTGMVPSGELRSFSQAYFDSRVTWARSCVPMTYRLSAPPQGQPLFPFQVGNYGTGANFAVRREVVRRLGGFDEALGVGSPTQGGEDIDMFVRVLLSGHALRYSPAAIVWHRHRPDLSTLASQVRDYGLGLGAWMTKLALQPRTLPMVARRAPGAVLHARKMTEVALPNVSVAADEPLFHSLRTNERAGIFLGPFAYARARREGRRATPFRNRRLRPTSLRDLVAPSDADAPAVRYQPTCLLVLDAEAPPTEYDPGTTPSGERYARALVLIREGGRPVGDVELALEGGVLTAARAAEVVSEVRRRQRIPLPEQRSEDRSRERPFVSVVIATFQRPDQLKTCLTSVLACDYPSFEVIVVDNAPHDARTSEMIRQEFNDEPRVRYLQEPRPGTSRARNRGARAAHGTVLAFTDDDVRVDPAWLARLVDTLETDQAIGAVTGLVVPARLDTAVHQWFEQFGGFNRGYEPRSFDLKEQRGTTLLYPWTAGAIGASNNIAFRREALPQDGPFDTRLGPGTPSFAGEDQDLIVRLLRAGWTIRYEPSALVHHHHRDTYPHLRWQMFTYGAGQTAAFAHWFCRDLESALELGVRVPKVLATVGARALTRRRQPGEGQTSTPEAEFPTFLRRLVWLGYAYGPVAYSRSLFANRRTDARTSR